MFGDIKVMVPGEKRQFRHTRAARFAHFRIERARLAAIGLADVPLRPWVMLRDQALRHVVEALVAETTVGPSSRLFEDAAVQAIVARLIALDGQPPVSAARRGLGGARLARVLERLEDELASDLSVPELAGELELSPSHFSALFGLAVGEPPHRYQTRRRVERARELILAGSTPADAAIAVGFYDQSHLSRHMRKLLGTSPSALRKLRG